MVDQAGRLAECFGIVNVVPIDLCMPSFFKVVIITRLFLVRYFRSHSFPGQSLLLSTTKFNDNVMMLALRNVQKYRITENFVFPKCFQMTTLSIFILENCY